MDSEQAVDLMTRRGRIIVNAALDKYKPVAVLAAFSGGNDSVVSTHFGCSVFQAVAMNMGTGIGIEKPRCHMRDTCVKHGWDLIEQAAQVQGKPSGWTGPEWVDGETAYEEAVLNYGFPGNAQHGAMYRRLKERPLRKVIAALKQGQPRRAHVLIISGIRHDESAIRAGYKSAVRKNGSAVWVNPFYFQTSADFEFYRQEYGLPRNPVSDRIGFSGECLCGAFCQTG